MVVVLLLGLVSGLGILGVAVFVVTALRRRRIWSEPGLPMHELIAPTGELQDPQFADRRLPRSEWAAARSDKVASMSLMSRAPWSVQKSARSVHHG